MATFMVVTFITGSFQQGLGSEDKIGYPFVFFSAFNEGEVLQNKYFSLIALVIDFLIYFIIGYIFVSVMNLLKVDRENNRRFIRQN